MKNKILLAICCILMVGFVGCGKAEGQASGEDTAVVETVNVADTTELLTNVWGSYEESELFPIAGGDYDNSVMDAPGKYDVSKVEDMDAVLGLPQASASMVDDAASIMHMMNANTFTAGAYHLTDSANMQTVADSLKENIMNRQWMCGFPDTLIIVSVGNEYVVSAFGNAEIIETFKTKIQGQYEMAEVLYEESLTE